MWKMLKANFKYSLECFSNTVGIPLSSESDRDTSFTQGGNGAACQAFKTSTMILLLSVTSINSCLLFTSSPKFNHRLGQAIHPQSLQAEELRTYWSTKFVDICNPVQKYLSDAFFSIWLSKN